MNESFRQEIISLETRLAFQENMIEELNMVVYRQQKQLDFLMEKYPEIVSKIRAMDKGENVVNSQDEAPPPHY